MAVYEVAVRSFASYDVYTIEASSPEEAVEVGRRRTLDVCELTVVGTVLKEKKK